MKLSLPMTEGDARSLRAGQYVLLNGLVVTGRDKVHKYLAGSAPPPETIPFRLEGAVLYHCGPVIREENGVLQVVSAGPTTSFRMQMYEPFVIEHYKIRAVMGKGGMKGPTVEAMRRSGCVYLNAIGGAGALLAERIKTVKGAWMLEEFGRAEAMWAFVVEDFPAVVTIDTVGGNIHEEVEIHSKEALRKITASH